MHVVCTYGVPPPVSLLTVEGTVHHLVGVWNVLHSLLKRTAVKHGVGLGECTPGHREGEERRRKAESRARARQDDENRRKVHSPFTPIYGCLFVSALNCDSGAKRSICHLLCSIDPQITSIVRKPLGFKLRELCLPSICCFLLHARRTALFSAEDVNEVMVASFAAESAKPAAQCKACQASTTKSAAAAEAAFGSPSTTAAAGAACEPSESSPGQADHQSGQRPAGALTTCQRGIGSGATPATTTTIPCEWQRPQAHCVHPRGRRTQGAAGGGASGCCT